MKIILVLLLALNLYAFDIKLASKIFDKLFVAVVQKEEVLVYTQDREYFEVIQLAKHLTLLDNTQNADIVLVNKKENIPKDANVVLFTVEYEIFKETQSSVGIFYWKHGRPKIIFLKERLDQYDISLDSNWDKYIKSEDEL